ncbi:MAG TPA: acetolactate synthase large subunit [Gammaproteobacteria bacterium]|nr:acetolactate synthase large subunit [Gammaproteobacteria bacterium]
MNAAQLMIRCLEEEGVRYLFGVPGEENADFMMALEDSSRIQFILTRHEQGAAFMAEVYGRLTGEVAVCLGTLGPGATNLITGVADGNMDRAPMLVITGQGASTRLHKESHQVMDVVAMFRPVTKWAVSVRNANDIPEIIRKAIRVATEEKPGAVHIELPEDVAKQLSSATPLTPFNSRRPVADEQSLDAALELIKQASRPIIIAGNGCIRRRASQALRQFCHLTGIGVLNTFMAKGAVDRNAPYCLYTIGLADKDMVGCGIDAADLILTLGYDMVEYPPSLWNPNRDKIIIHADFLPAEVDDHYNPEVECIGDLAATLTQLNKRLEVRPHLKFDLSQQAAVRRSMTEEIEAFKDDDADERIKPQKVLYDVRELLGPTDILLSDVGAHKMWIARYYQCDEPNTCLIPNGFCSMGFALPGAIAADLVYPDRKIMAICGDAGFLMNVQEMETARRLNSQLVVMVWNDGGHGLIKWKQENEFGRHTQLDFGNPHWLALAEAFSWNGHLISRSSEVKSVMQQALREPGPSLVVVPIDYRENQLLTQRLGDIQCPI